MRVDRFGAGLIGAVLLLVGVALLLSDLDPLALCFKQCDIPKALVLLLGPTLFKLLVAGFFVVLSLLFLVPLINGGKNRKARD